MINSEFFCYKCFTHHHVKNLGKDSGTRKTCCYCEEAGKVQSRTFEQKVEPTKVNAKIKEHDKKIRREIEKVNFNRELAQIEKEFLSCGI